MNAQDSHFYGGQAVMEGVMMRGKQIYAMAVRKPSGDIAVVEHTITKPTSPTSTVARKIPILRGIIAFGSAMKIGVLSLTESAEIATDGELEEGNFEKFLKRKLGDRANDILMQISILLAVAMAVLIFILLPLWIGGFLFSLTNANPALLGIIEGLLRLVIFVGYILLISRSKDIARVFEYHGAEHKTINAYESQLDLTVENIRKCSRLHKRCGTSFLLIVMFISIVVFTFVSTPDPLVRLLTRLVLIPVIAGFSYEIIRLAGKSKSSFVKIISFPGMRLQQLTTREPDDGQIEVAVSALKAVLERETNERDSEKPLVIAP
ncbi:MAG: DUF1385 domain-containing protein [Turicibacter sp.]|nr:DUF1385 domain-containing protein [Turicibacter sp.]